MTTPTARPFPLCHHQVNFHLFQLACFEQIKKNWKLLTFFLATHFFWKYEQRKYIFAWIRTLGACLCICCWNVSVFQCLCRLFCLDFGGWHRRHQSWSGFGKCWSQHSHNRGLGQDWRFFVNPFGKLIFILKQIYDVAGRPQTRPHVLVFVWHFFKLVKNDFWFLGRLMHGNLDGVNVELGAVFIYGPSTENPIDRWTTQVCWLIHGWQETPKKK